MGDGMALAHREREVEASFNKHIGSLGSSQRNGTSRMKLPLLTGTLVLLD